MLKLVFQRTPCFNISLPKQYIAPDSLRDWVRLLMFDYNFVAKGHNNKMTQSDTEAWNMRLLHVPYRAEQQMQFGLRQLCRYGYSDEKRPKMLAKEADICLSKGERSVLSFCNSAQVVFSLFQSGCRGRTEPHNSLHYERCISQCLVTPTAGRLFTPQT